VVFYFQLIRVDALYLDKPTDASMPAATKVMKNKLMSLPIESVLEAINDLPSIARPAISINKKNRH